MHIVYAYVQAVVQSASDLSWGLRVLLVPYIVAHEELQLAQPAEDAQPLLSILPPSLLDPETQSTATAAGKQNRT